jgi:uncharacterized protein YegL
MTGFDQVFADLFDVEPGQAEEVEFITDTHRRRLVALLIDTSQSMAATQVDGVRAIDVLNQELARWLPRVRAEGHGTLRDVEFAVVTFGHNGVVVASGRGRPEAEDGEAFVPAAGLTLPTLQASGATPMTEAVELTLRLLDERRQQVQTIHGQQTGVPRMILISDGGPTDLEGNPTGRWRQLAQRLAQWRSSGRVQLFAFGVPGVDDEVMRALATDAGYFPLAELDVKKLLDLILVATSAHNPFHSVWQTLFEEGDQ